MQVAARAEAEDGARAKSKRSLKIEQRREKYKANTKVRSKLEQFKKRNTTQTKSKRATKARE